MSYIQLIEELEERHAVDNDPVSYACLVRWQALSSLYYLTKMVLGYKELTSALHLPVCDTIQNLRSKNVIELPRGHFKTTIASKSLPIWRGLPLTEATIDYVLKNGLANEDRLRQLLKVHDPNIRILIVSETDVNAKKILRAIRNSFESNAMLRSLWPEVLPDANSRWTDNELCLKRDQFYSESTFEAVGVGSALQSRHFNFIIEDDLVGRDALGSETIMERTIDYHTLLEGAFDQPDEAESLVIGNRWAFNDLNSWIKDNQPEYHFITRSAIEDGVPIFPERFSMDGFARISRSQGAYLYSCQYLNNPVAPGAHDFEQHWLKTWKYIEELKPDGSKVQALERSDGKKTYLGRLNRFVLIDPNREGMKKTSSRSAVIVVGVDDDDDDWLLRTWAERSTTDRMMNKAFELYDQFKCQKAGIEGYGGDSHLKNYMNYKAKVEKKTMRIIVFKKDSTKSKEERARAMQPRYEVGKVAIPEGETEFLHEYISFPSGKTMDLLDAYSHREDICRAPASESEKKRLQDIDRQLKEAVNARSGY